MPKYHKYSLKQKHREREETDWKFEMLALTRCRCEECTTKRMLLLQGIREDLHLYANYTASELERVTPLAFSVKKILEAALEEIKCIKKKLALYKKVPILILTPLTEKDYDEITDQKEEC